MSQAAARRQTAPTPAAGEGAPFKYLDEAAIARLEIKKEPYEWGHVPDCMPQSLKEKVLADAPVIPTRGSYPIKSYFGLPRLRYGKHFDGVIQELLSDRFRKIVEKKFNMDLRNNPPCIVMMGNTTGHYNEGYAHPDSRHKIVTVLVGFTREWPYEKGRLRILRSSDRDDYAFEFPPEFGAMLMFKVSDKSWHGFLPQKGPRMSLQLCYMESDYYVRREYFRHGVSALAKSNPFLNKLIGIMPKNLYSLVNKGKR